MRRKHEEEHENHERWLVSYADFITLLFAFFTTLYAISTVDAQKMGKMVQSMQAAFENKLFSDGSRSMSLAAGAGSNPSSLEMLKTADQVSVRRGKDVKLENRVKIDSKTGERELRQLKSVLETLLSDEILKGRVRAYIEPRGLIISLGEGGMFDSGADQIKPEGKELLDKIASTLVPLKNQVRIEGHTDNVPISNSRFPSNWELSTARATAVIAHLIVRFGLRPDLLSAAGYGEYRPAASNLTEAGRAINRRVDIVVMNAAAAGLEPY